MKPRKPIIMTTGRDITERQFAAALERNGFRRRLLWFYDTTGVCPAIGFGGIIHPATGRTDRRATLAWIIQLREIEVEKRRAEAEAATLTAMASYIEEHTTPGVPLRIESSNQRMTFLSGGPLSDHEAREEGI